MHLGSYYDSVLAIEMKKKKNSESFFNYDANLTSVIAIELKFSRTQIFFLCDVGFSGERH